VIGLLGGAFDPPHNGHLALARTAQRHFGLEPLIVLVSAHPGHKRVVLDAATRLRLARAAFPELQVELDEHERTIDLLRARNFDDPLFLVGADQFAELLSWKQPDGILELARLGVATRPGYPRERLDTVLAKLRRPERVAFFDLEPLPIASRELRDRVANGDPIDAFVPHEVAALVEELGLYRP
jgi:nicotinate-nucleotide adenylyltransferase